MSSLHTPNDGFFLKKKEYKLFLCIDRLILAHENRFQMNL